MGINLFLDDFRRCPEGFVLTRTFEECILMLTECEIDILSLDHDLGTDKSGYDVAKWIVEHDRWPKEIRFHTSNPVGRENMHQLLSRYAPVQVKVVR